MHKKSIKAYIAGPLSSQKEREFVKDLSLLCERLGIKTFLPHRDVGLWRSFRDTKKIAKGDLQGFHDCQIFIASLNGFVIGAGTSWEMGYAHARGIPVIGIKTDKKIKDSIEELSAIIVGTTKIVTSLKELKIEIKKLLKNIRF